MSPNGNSVLQKEVVKGAYYGPKPFGKGKQIEIGIHNHYYLQRFIQKLEKGVIPTLWVVHGEMGTKITACKGAGIVTVTPRENNVELRLNGYCIGRDKRPGSFSFHPEFGCPSFGEETAPCLEG